MKENWKLLVAIAACVVIGLFCARRVYNAFYSRPPGWVKQEDRVGPAISKSEPVRAAWKKFSDLLAVARHESEQRQLPIGTVSLLAIQPGGTNAVFILTQAVINQGFNPLRNIQSTLGGDEKGFVGFYATAGTPIPFTIVRVQGRPRNPPVTLHLENTIAPGATQMVARIEWRRAPVNVGKDGKLHAGLGRFPRTPNAVYARAVNLPSGSAIVRSGPPHTATEFDGVSPLVSWIGTAADAGAPMNVVFTLPK